MDSDDSFFSITLFCISDAYSEIFFFNSNHIFFISSIANRYSINIHTYTYIRTYSCIVHIRWNRKLNFYLVKIGLQERLRFITYFEVRNSNPRLHIHNLIHTTFVFLIKFLFFTKKMFFLSQNT